MEAKPDSTPADPGIKLIKDNASKSVNPDLYQSMVESLLYAAIATRPDIAQAVEAVSKFNSEPNQTHLTAVKRILIYLKGTADLALKYQQTDNCSFIGYSDADWAGDQNDRHNSNR